MAALVDQLGRDVSRIELCGPEDSSCLTLRGEGERFAFYVIVGESDYYYHSSGKRANGTLVDIAGHSFDEDWVCRDRQLLVRVSEEFFARGHLLAEVSWVHERVDD